MSAGLLADKAMSGMSSKKNQNQNTIFYWKKLHPDFHMDITLTLVTELNVFAEKSQPLMR